MSAAIAGKEPKRGFIRDATGDPSRPRRTMPNTRRSNIWYLGQLLLALPWVPLWPVFVSLESRDPYYVNHYFETISNCFRTLYHAIRNRSLLRIFKYNFFSTTAYVEEQLGSRLGACTRCAKCCKMLKCEYLAYNKDEHEYYCSVYNTPFWVFGACGRYPIDQSDVDDYNCPGFAFPESVAAAAAGKPILLSIGKMPKR